MSINGKPLLIAGALGKAAGSIATFPDGNGGPFRKLVVGIDPVQAGSGDPSPDNVRPISGWDEVEMWRTGKNLFNPANETLVRLTNNNGIYTASDGDTATTLSFKVQQRGANYALIAGTQVNRVGITTPGRIPFTGTIAEGCQTIRFSNAGTSIEFSLYMPNPFPVGSPYTFSVNILDMTIGSVKFDTPQLELGSTATPYAPYTGTAYPITIPTPPGTVYGGYIHVAADGSAELVVDRAEVDMGTLTWGYSSTTQKFSAVISNKKVRYSADVGSKKILCSALATIGAISSVYTAVADGSIFELAQSGGSNTVSATDSAYTDAASFKSAMTGQTIVYELDTPINYQLSPIQVQTLLGQNNIWADCGDVAVEYIKRSLMFMS